MMVYINYHLSNTWNSYHEKIKQHWGSVKKNVAYKKRVIKLRCFMSLCDNIIWHSNNLKKEVSNITEQDDFFVLTT